MKNTDLMMQHSEEIKQNQAQHTPGPWETGARMTRVEVYPPGWRVPMLIADCHGKYSPDTESERVANARLIAAAPQLLAALQWAQVFIPENKGNCRETCRAAIAKATGQD